MEENKFNVAFFDNCSTAPQKILEESGIINVKFYKDAVLNWENDILPNLDVICVRSKTKVRGDIIEKAPNLLAIGRVGIGTNNIGIEEATKNGIVIFNTPGGNANAVKELVIAFAISASRKLPQAFHSRFKGEWNKSLFKGEEIAGKTIGIVGMGSVGQLVAAAMRNLGLNIVYYDPFLITDFVIGRRAADLNDVLREADILTLHVPANSQTADLLNSRTLQGAKKGIIIINTARGELVNLDDMRNALVDGTVKYYITDVFSEEPPSDHPIFGLNNFASLPHLGASTQEAEEKCAMMIGEQIKDYLLYGHIKNSVNAPNICLEKENHQKVYRLAVFHRDVPHVLDSIAEIRKQADINVANEITRRKKEKKTAVTLTDFDNPIEESIIHKIEQLENILKVKYFEL